MARTFEDIRNQIAAKKNELLPQLSSTSATAIWWLWANIVATAIFTFEQIFYTEKAALEKETEAKRYGSVNWYALQVLKFQYGDVLVFDSDTGLFAYPAIDEGKMIVVRAAVNEGIEEKELLIKVAKKDTNNELVPLNASEITALNAYLNDIRVAGVDFQIFSILGDIIDGIADVFYDGNYNLNDIQTAINDALNIYRDNFSFNGTLLKNDIIDVIRDVNGVTDIHFSLLTGKSGSLNPIIITRDYNTTAGYFNYQANWITNWNFIPKHTNPNV